MQKPISGPPIGVHERTCVAQPGWRQIDRAARPDRMLAPVGRQALLMRAPAELGRLQAFADEAGHAPGVDELARPLGPAGDLGVVLGDVDHLGAGPLRQARPALPRRRRVGLEPGAPAISSSATLTKWLIRPGLAPWVMSALGDLGRPVASPSASPTSADNSWCAHAPGSSRCRSNGPRARCRCRDRGRRAAGTSRSGRAS